MNSLVVLYRILRKFYGELKRIEKFFLYTYIIDMVIYSFLFVGSLILAGDFDIYFVLTPLIFFPIISGIIMFYGRTVYHGLAFLGVHMFPVAAGIANFYTQYFNCRDRDRANACQADLKFYTIGTTFLIAISILFQLLHTLYVYLIWKKGIWPLVYKFKNSRHDEIKEMHAIYEVQFPLFHAQVMMIGLLLFAYLIGICGITLVALTKRRIRSRNIFINYQVPLNIIFLYYSYFMLKGVRDEKHYMMCIVYVGNVIQAILLYFDMASFCEKVNTIIKADHPLQCFQYSMTVCAFLIYACLCWIVLALSTWNTIRCHKNFGRHMSHYITYEPTPPEFKPGRKLVIRESSVPKYSHIV
ncbi:unnamed protein product [Rhizophagus irregularis]|uniref:Uncharacterized protein n=1 Tax=Rhizophagus irregularis TaxID=588596 RepID=A0A2I1GM17_9GLOM|nr:hypothetical protein RhiirA4_462980 [Rhizophagus irregularis]CAB4439959.1 unnamed protein product [Rhizophagus irregularis]